MFKSFLLELNISAVQTNYIFAVNSNDLNTIRLDLVIKDNAALVDLTGKIIRLAIRKPDNTVVFQPGGVTDGPGGKCEFILSKQAALVPGRHEGEVMIYEGDSTVAVTTKFYYEVKKAVLSNSDVESSSDFPAISQAIAAGEILKEIDIHSVIEAGDKVAGIQTQLDEARQKDDGTLFGTVQERLNDTDEKIESNTTLLTNTSSSVNNKLKWKTPYDYGCLGTGLVDDSIGFRRMLVEDTNLPIKIPSGTFRIDSAEKMPLLYMEGDGSTKSIIKFTHKDGGFIKYKDGSPTTYGGFGHFKNLCINGNGTTDYLITCGFASEGVCDDVRFESPAKSIFKIDYTLELVFFNSCTMTNAPKIFEVSDSAEPFNSINGVFINGGNLWMIDEVISTKLGGKATLNGVWMEKVATILNKTGDKAFDINVNGGNLVKSYKTDPLFKLACKGEDSVIFKNVNSYFAIENTSSIIHITPFGDNVATIKSIVLGTNRITASVSANLQNIATVDPLVTMLVNIRIKTENNSLSFVFSWWNNIKSKIATGLVVSGTSDSKLIGNNFIGPLKFHETDQEAVMTYDTTLKQIYTSDSGGSVKYFYLIGKPYATRPTGVQIGHSVYDSNLKIPIWYQGSGVWVNAMGTVV